MRFFWHHWLSNREQNQGAEQRTDGHEHEDVVPSLAIEQQSCDEGRGSCNQADLSRTQTGHGVARID